MTGSDGGLERPDMVTRRCQRVLRVSGYYESSWQGRMGDMFAHAMACRRLEICPCADRRKGAANRWGKAIARATHKQSNDPLDIRSPATEALKSILV